MGLLRESHVRVCDYDGREVPLVLGDELRVSYKKVTFLVPEDNAVYINDKKVDSSFITDTVESDVEGVTLNKYAVDGILNDFEYCVRDEKDRDMLLEEENDTVCLKKIKYLIDAPQGFDVYVNGKNLIGSILRKLEWKWTSLSTSQKNMLKSLHMTDMRLRYSGLSLRWL